MLMLYLFWMEKREVFSDLGVPGVCFKDCILG